MKTFRGKNLLNRKTVTGKISKQELIWSTNKEIGVNE